jgi:hypothetical protein
MGTVTGEAAGGTWESVAAAVLARLGLPMPRVRFPVSLAEWSAREELLAHVRRRHPAAVQHAWWWMLRREQPFPVVHALPGGPGDHRLSRPRSGRLSAATLETFR